MSALIFISANAFAETMVDINHAGVDRLVLLKGIGRKYAEKIVKYRNRNGFFRRKEDLLHIKGIGPKILEKNNSKILIVLDTKKKPVAKIFKNKK